MATSSPSRPHTGRAPVQLAALVVGAVFLVVGILGFVPGITTNFDQLTFAGHHSGAMLLGIFHVSILHNLVHLAFGVAGPALSRTFVQARLYLLVSAVLYAALGVYGVVIGQDSAANFVPVNTADNWLHFGLAALMAALGLTLGKGGAELTTRSSTGIIE
ncbi:hypothetical protein MCHIJ_43130 [Mycolicibacterium chitae]|uniref:DUF4383 domain-containing protein n=1 Tax=Mycolicibacterium chitae TaxID=1792 RepID=A0A3S4VCA5_MYCCI|nr:DUF4383 domain-containing protein [Mycolicibacterium chitae]MCV7104207.1 DUF4383 domain-containing protein [Mycolicibacterium chitae]BBZ04876.1 hypothetical protein MCHIJ_43130 [Mycolicibacterium chitae]VEG48500.1 Uncharacterised protein [Mycolicibacterium chitae]